MAHRMQQKKLHFTKVKTLSPDKLIPGILLDVKKKRELFPGQSPKNIKVLLVLPQQLIRVEGEEF